MPFSTPISIFGGICYWYLGGYSSRFFLHTCKHTHTHLYIYIRHCWCDLDFLHLTNTPIPAANGSVLHPFLENHRSRSHLPCPAVSGRSMRVPWGQPPTSDWITQNWKPGPLALRWGSSVMPFMLQSSRWDRSVGDLTHGMLPLHLPSWWMWAPVGHTQRGLRPTQYFLSLEV